jgi:hypothetical protein
MKGGEKKRKAKAIRRRNQYGSQWTLPIKLQTERLGQYVDEGGLEKAKTHLNEL